MFEGLTSAYHRRRNSTKSNFSSIIICGLLWLLLGTQAHAMSNKIFEKLVEMQTETFFDLMTKNKFDDERAFMTPEFAQIVNSNDWADSRQRLVDQLGSTPRYQVHNVTYYDQVNLYAAVDFVGQAAKSDLHVCGYIVWELRKPNRFGLIRLETNVVSETIFKKMPLQEAAQLMTNWKCSTGLIETILGVKLQK
jgi:hypothetical protein